MDLNLIIEDATANPIKFTLDGAPVDKRARFDQQRYAQANHTTIDPDKAYKQKFEKADTVRLQFYSNFPLNKVTIVDCDDTVYGPAMSPQWLWSIEINSSGRSACLLPLMASCSFIFTKGWNMKMKTSLCLGDLIAWNGRLPNINAVLGDVVRYSFDGTPLMLASSQKSDGTPTLQAEGYLIDVPMTLVNPVAGWWKSAMMKSLQTFIHCSFLLLPLQPGKYFIRREHGIDAYDVSFTSEPLDMQDQS